MIDPIKEFDNWIKEQGGCIKAEEAYLAGFKLKDGIYKPAFKKLLELKEKYDGLGDLKDDTYNG